MESKGHIQRESARRGFSISNQKVVLEIDFSGVLWGYTEITIIPNSPELRTIHLHSRQCAIHSVIVGSYPADFTHADPLANISFATPEEAQDAHRHAELKRKVYSALQEADEGELSIAIPKEVSLKQSSYLTATNEVATPEPQTPSLSQGVLEFNSIVVKISYSLRNPVDGFQFVIPNDAYPHRVPHAYTTPSSPDSARCWVPCIDNLWERCTWEFEFIVPRYLEEIDPLDDDTTDLSPTLVICSGELVEQVTHPFSSHKSVFLYHQPVPTSVQHIAVAAGPFHLYTIPSDDETTQAPYMYGFCLPGHESLLATSTSILRSAMTFYTSQCHGYPFKSYKVVFVDEMPTQRFDSASLSLLTVDLLHGQDAIEQAIETRHALSHALACQWVGINILPKTWSDLWLSNGLALYITGLFLRKLFGNNEYRFRLKKDMHRIMEFDNGSMPPICQPQIIDPPDPGTIAFINLKAPVVLHILDRRLGKSGTSLGLSRVLPKVFLSATSGEMVNNAISTHFFLRICRKVCGVDLRTFSDQWIHGSGCPSFGISASFNRKKMAVEITMRQETPAWKAHEGNEIMRVLLNPVQLFEGTMTIRIHEADGTPYEHVLDIHSPFKRYEVPFNTKYKRVRRNTKRYIARQAAAQAAAEGDAEAVEAMGMVDMGFGLEIWEKEKERENWKVADWTEEDESIMNGATYEWIRMDADFEWIANIKFDQPDFMWVSQLQRDRDVVAQLEAVYALALQPTAIVSSTLTKTVLVTNYHYRIRCEAVYALVQCAIRRLDFLGLFHLFKLFLRYCYEPEDPNQDLFSHTYVPKPNDFTDMSEYFVRKSLVMAISRVRFDSGKSPAVVRQFLIDQLRYNDNTANPYSDALYICTVISATACALVSTAPPERGELLPSEVHIEHTAEDQNLLSQSLTEVDRYRSMDRLISSPHNIVTIAALEFYLVLVAANLIPNQPKVFFPLTRDGNYAPVRIAAFDGLFLSKWYTPAMMQYILAVMANDSSRTVRRHVARSACYSLAILFQTGELKSGSKDSDPLLIEEDGSRPEQAKEFRKSEVEAMIKVLRKDKEIGKNEVLRKYLMPIALSPDVDHEVRWCLLKLADLLFRPVEETAPSVKIHIPVTPVADLQPQLPSVKVSVKAQRPLKPTQSITSPVVASPKLRLPAQPSEPGTRASTPRPPALPVPESPVITLPQARPKARPPQTRPPKSKNAPGRTGMSREDLTGCRNALKKLMVNKHSLVFRQPVDPIRDSAPNYFQIIKQPMDLSTMGAKLEAGQYKDRSAFQNDFRLMIANAQQYNQEGSYVYNETVALEAFFNKQWTKIVNTLEQLNKTQESRTAKILPPVPHTSFSPAPTDIVARPTIKLKVGGSQSRTDVHPAPKPKGRKSKLDQTSAPPTHVDVPPPPYIDDGSHDILQEVIALEEEKNRRRDKDKTLNGTSHKRKKTDSMLDDDILALATPSKRERPSPEPTSSSVVKITIPTKKLTNERIAEGNSDKGKGKAAVYDGDASFGSPHDRQPQAIYEKGCREVLKAIQKLPDAAIFAQPVDPVRDQCPTYLDEIEHPMDFGTISSKLSSGAYQTMQDFASDVELVLSNCRQFNPPTTFPCLAADAVERVFRKEWAKLTERKLPFAEKRGLLGIMTNFTKEPISWLFREPVDPVALEIPTYFEIIPKKDARDLRTIRQKLEGDKYETVEAFEADVELMFGNAIKFNGAESEIGNATYQARDKFMAALSNWKTTMSKKRKEGGAISTQPAKKLKLI